MDQLQIWLYYPLGTLPLLFFSLRFFLQWIESERKGQSVVTPLFWKLSLIGNSLLLIHYFLQMQYPFALFQVGNALIAWRNLELMRGKSGFISKMIKRFLVCFFLITVCFIVQGYWVNNFQWMRIPLKSLNSPNNIGINTFWHLLGLLGGGLFAARFWIQWWHAEKTGKSSLNLSFWLCSLGGSLLSLFYFIVIGDTVSIMNYSLVNVGNIRNLLLIRKKRTV